MSLHKPLPFVLGAVVLGTALVGSATAATSPGNPIASAAAECTTRNVPNPGPGNHFVYENVISSRGVPCATRNSVEDKFEACRLKHGLQGRCTTKVLGFTCKEVGPRQAGALKGQFNAAVTCTRAKATFRFGYEQN